MSPSRAGDLRVWLIVLGLIVVPSGLLGYFSWRAIQTQNLLAKEQLTQSYAQIARLAGRAIDDELELVATSWLDATEPVVEQPDAENLARLVEADPLIAEAFLLPAPGKVAYPTGMQLRDREATFETDLYVREQELFDRLLAQGEQLEYHDYDLESAVRTYQDLARRVTNPQLRAMAWSYVGRAVMKQGEWVEALNIFEALLRDHPEARDLNKMYLRFVAQVQITICLESLGRDEEAIQRLLSLNEDLLTRSDTINVVQYLFYTEQIRSLASRLLTSPEIDAPDSYRLRFEALAEKNKSRISHKYFLQQLDRRLYEMVIKRRQYKPKLYYLADQADQQPYLLVYRGLPDPSGTYVAGLLALQIDLDQLRTALFPRILSRLEVGDQAVLSLRDHRGQPVLGSATPGNPISIQDLAPPFAFWEVAVDLSDDVIVSTGFSTLLGVWLVSLLLLSIVLGAIFLIRRVRREARLSQMKTTFVSRMSHELRTPLTSIRMMAELLEMKLGDHPDRQTRQQLGVIERECDRLSRLIENVLDFSKMERDVKQFRFEYEDPALVLSHAVESFRPYARSQGFEIELQTPVGIPELEMDADAIAQVLLNLLSNAVRYGREDQAGSESGTIHVSVLREADRVHVDVQDKGIGIDTQNQERIFDEFYRIDQSLRSSHQTGLGLGLTVVRSIVQAHGGEVSVSSAPGSGSTFRFSLPVPVGATAIHSMEVEPLRES